MKVQGWQYDSPLPISFGLFPRFCFKGWVYGLGVNRSGQRLRKTPAQVLGVILRVVLRAGYEI